MSANDYTVKKVDFIDLSKKAKDAYWKAFKELYSAEGSAHVGNQTQEAEGNGSKIISTYGRPGADALGSVVIQNADSLLPHSERGQPKSN